MFSSQKLRINVNVYSKLYIYLIHVRLIVHAQTILLSTNHKHVGIMYGFVAIGYGITSFVASVRVRLTQSYASTSMQGFSA